MASDVRRNRAGQAMTEFVIAILAIVLIIAASVEYLPIFLENIGLLKEVREEASGPHIFRYCLFQDRAGDG